MPGVFGGTATGSALAEMHASMSREPWYGEERFEDEPFGLGSLHHGDRDPEGWTTWTDGRSAGVLHGSVSNRDELSLSTGELFERLLDDPATLLAELAGPFAVAAYDADADRFVLATDKIGSRPLYYWDGDRLLAGSSLKPVLAGLDDPRLDERGVSDLLLMGYLWGDKTLVRDVRRIPPATVLVYEAGETTTERYWHPSFDPASPGREYLDGLVTTYLDAVEQMSTTVDDTVGLWLSGGLDSRAMMAGLNWSLDDGTQFDRVRAYTYDSNPAGAGNPELAGRIADALGFELRQVTVGPEDFTSVLDQVVELTDGMVRWTSAMNIAATFQLGETRPGVMIEASGQGELLGERVWRPHLDQPPVQSMYVSEADVDADTVHRVLGEAVDPLATYRDEVRRSDEQHGRQQIMDAHLRNHYSRGHFQSNEVARSQVGVRTPFASGAFLEHVARLPVAYHLGTVPFTGGRVPAGTTQPKLHLVRALDPRLADIPYERSRIPPSRPQPVHAAGYVATKSSNVLQERLGLGPVREGEWSRTYEPMRTYLNDLLDAAADRPHFDGDTVRELQDEHMNDQANHLSPLASITTVEIWQRWFLD